MPAYREQTAHPHGASGVQDMPAPQQAPAPVVTPASPTLQTPYTALPAYAPGEIKSLSDTYGSAYIPVDSWVYPAMVRLYSLGYLNTMYLSMRPFTRRSALHILQGSEGEILSSSDVQAQEILSALLKELTDEGITNASLTNASRAKVYGVQSVYTRVLGISGSILQDSFHLGQTFFNDYGRPEEAGFNNITGFSTLNEQGRFSLYVRGEYQHAPSAYGYQPLLANYLGAVDQTCSATVDSSCSVLPPLARQATIPLGAIAAQNPFRLVEATLSYHILGHEISGGKSDAWIGPGMGSAMAWSNNAENIYSFRINRVEPLHIKYLSRLLGPLRYDFFYGSLKGHTVPNDDWVHSDSFSFQPTRDFQFGFQRTVIFGGKGHEPVTLRTFLKGFFDTNDTNQSEKFSRNDPGARFSAFNFSYRLPFARHWLTLYADSEAHDDLTPVSAPRRAAYRPGIYLSQFPGAKRLDLRVEGVSTDCSTLACVNGSHQYVESAVQRQGYTNKGYILGDWIGREAKGGQAWLTYHLSGNEWVQLAYLNKKTAKDFIPGGTTQNQFRVDVVKRILPSIEAHAWYQYESWKAPIYLPGAQNDNSFSMQVTFFPKLKTSAR
ncbi:MAG TPA: capsule assembly Wzi family protein [Acidobacteriaceae bacterium]|nr:capsule assembly Wzi family protein [Acidobacteriaceae bacterium]